MGSLIVSRWNACNRHFYATRERGIKYLKKNRWKWQIQIFNLLVLLFQFAMFWQCFRRQCKLIIEAKSYGAHRRCLPINVELFLKMHIQICLCFNKKGHLILVVLVIVFIRVCLDVYFDNCVTFPFSIFSMGLYCCFASSCFSINITIFLGTFDTSLN